MPPEYQPACSPTCTTGNRRPRESVLRFLRELQGKDVTRLTFEITSAVSAKVEHLCNPVLARKSSINLVPILYPLPSAQAHLMTSRSAPVNYDVKQNEERGAVSYFLDSHLLQLLIDLCIIFIILPIRSFPLSVMARGERRTDLYELNYESTIR